MENEGIVPMCYGEERVGPKRENKSGPTAGSLRDLNREQVSSRRKETG